MAPKKSTALQKILSCRIKERYLCIALIVVFLFLLIPLLLIAQYAVPCADDFNYGVLTHRAWETEHSVSSVLAAAGAQVADSYQQWQGTFAAIFLMALQPAVFGEQYYVLGPVLMYAVFICGTFFFCWALFRKFFGAGKCQFLILSVVWTSLCLQMPPSALEGFYWFNGSVFYTFFFSISLFFYGLVILYLQSDSQKKKTVYFILLCFLAILIGGSNYTTSLLTFVILLSLSLILFFSKHKDRKIFLVLLGILTAAFLLNMAAPGNAVRQSRFPSHPSLLKAVWMAICFAIDRANLWLSISMILVLAILAPVFWRIASNTAFSFRYPLLMGIVSSGLYALQFCPPAYAMGTKGPDRLQNIIFFSFIFLLLFNWFYVIGWICKKLPALTGEDSILSKIRGQKQGYSSTIMLGLTALFLLSCYAISFPVPFTSKSAAASLISGEAQQYHQEAQERFAILNDKNVTEAYLKPYSVWPYVLCSDDESDDPTYWRNQSLAEYYGKSAVALTEPSPLAEETAEKY